MAEIAETVKVPVFTFNEVVYTCAGYSFFFFMSGPTHSDTYILLVFRAPCQIAV